METKRISAVAVLLKFALPLAFILMNMVTMEFTNHDPDGGPAFYGFPIPFKTGTWVNSFEKEIYFKGLLIDGIVYLGISFIFFFLVTKALKYKLILNIIFLTVWVLAALILVEHFIFFSYHTYLWSPRYPLEYTSKSFFLDGITF